MLFTTKKYKAFCFFTHHEKYSFVIQEKCFFSSLNQMKSFSASTLCCRSSNLSECSCLCGLFHCSIFIQELTLQTNKGWWTGHQAQNRFFPDSGERKVLMIVSSSFSILLPGKKTIKWHHLVILFPSHSVRFEYHLVYK